VQLPQDQEVEAPATNQIVLEIDARGNYRINTRPVARENLEGRLREIYSGRPDKVLFVKADGEVIYQDVIAAMDAARGAGVKVLGSVLET
jgi:biopolymer transport protein ExbD